MTYSVFPTRRNVVGGLLSLGALGRSAQAQTSQMRIGIQFGISYLPFYVAEKRGLFDKHMRAASVSTHVVLRRFNGSTALNDALLSNNIDLLVGGTSAIILLWDRTRNTTLATSAYMGLNKTPGVLLTLRDDFRSLKDVRPNDRIAMPSLAGNPAYTLRMAAERDLGAANKLDTYMVALPHPDAVRAFLSGTEVTAYFSAEPFTTIAERDPRVRRVIDGVSIFGQPTDWVTIAGRNSFAEQNPIAVRCFFAAMQEAFDMIAASPREAAEIYLAVEPSRELDVGTVEKILSNPANSFSAEIRGLMAYASFMHKSHDIRTMPASWQDLVIPLARDRHSN